MTRTARPIPTDSRSERQPPEHWAPEQINVRPRDGGLESGVRKETRVREGTGAGERARFLPHGVFSRRSQPRGFGIDAYGSVPGPVGPHVYWWNGSGYEQLTHRKDDGALAVRVSPGFQRVLASVAAVIPES